MKQWRHPDYGDFRWSLFRWKGKVSIGKDEVASMDVTIETKDGTLARPCDEAVSVLDGALLDRRQIIHNGCERLLAEISGAERTEAWWGDPKQWYTVNKPTTLEELSDCLSFHSLSIRFFPGTHDEPSQFVNPFTNEIHEPPIVVAIRPEFWAAEFSFRSTFEAEHGISFLWHNGTICATGYWDMTPPLSYSFDLGNKD